MAKTKGGAGKGETKSIAWRQEQAILNKKSKRRGSTGIHEVEALPTLGIAELIRGALATGHRVEIEGAVFEALEGGAQLTLVSASDAKLGRFVNQAQNVFVWVHDLVKDEFNSPLRGIFADKQIAMWQHVVNNLEDDEIEALEVRIGIQREQHRAQRAEEREQAVLAQKFVGENIEIWDRAVGKADIANAFDAMTAASPVEIRISTVGQDSHYGVVLGFFFDTATNGMKIHVGHVGEKFKFAGKIPCGTYLQCFGGKLPEMLPATLPPGVHMIHELIMGLDRTVRDPIMHGMYRAVKRITAPSAPRPQPPVLQLVQRPAQAAAPQQVLAEPTAVEMVAPTTSQPVKVDLPTPVPQSIIAELVQSLRAAGCTPQEIGKAIAAYHAENSSSQSA